CVFITCLILMSAVLASRIELATWKNSFSLFEHANLAVKNIFVAHTQLGVAFAEIGELDIASSHLYKALAIRPELAVCHAGLGRILSKQNRFQEAIPHLRIGCAAYPDDVELRLLLARALMVNENATTHKFREDISLAQDVSPDTNERDPAKVYLEPDNKLDPVLGRNAFYKAFLESRLQTV